MNPDVLQTVIRLAARAALTDLFRPGQTLRAFVGKRGAQLVLLARGARIPIPDPGGLKPGQGVKVEVAQGKAGVELRILGPASRPAGRMPEPGGGPLLDRAPARPGPTAATPRAPTAAPARPAVAKAPGGPARAGGAAPSQAVVRAVLPTLAGRSTLATDLRRIIRLVAAARSAGALPAGMADQARGALEGLLVTRPDALAQLLRRATRASARSLESKLAEAVAGGDADGLEEALRNDPRAVASSLRRQGGLAAWLRQTQQLAGFDKAIEGALDRLSAGQLANLREHGQPYLFVELPFSPETPVRRCQLRFFTGGRDGRQRDRTLTVVFDLATRRLGDLWVSLRLDQDRCWCRICAADPDAEASLREAAPELMDGLATVGYAGAQVEVLPWDGDRLREVGELMRGVTGIDVQA